MLGEDFNLIFAADAQRGIDLISEHFINLVLLDIQMPGLSGIELMESTMADFALQRIPVVVFSGKPTKEIRETSLRIGASDFISKDEVFKERENFKEKIKKFALPKAKRFIIFGPKEKEFKGIYKRLLSEVVHGDFFTASRKFTTGLMNVFEFDYISFWKLIGKKPTLILSLGEHQPENFGPDELLSEQSYREVIRTKRPYFTNNPTSEKKGVFANKSKELGLSSEIGIPLFRIDRETFMLNNMVVPGNTPLFGFMVLKRKRVFTTKEFNLISRFVIQSGTVLWGMYKKLYKENA
jgi:CheY-like chemotaxis protein